MGCAQTTLMSGFITFRNRESPISVPDVPIAQTR